MLRQLFSVVRFIRRHPLARGHQLKAIADFARWQIASRLLGRKVVIPWVDGTRLMTGPGETGLTGNLYCGLMEYEDMRLGTATKTYTARCLPCNSTQSRTILGRAP